MSALLSLQGAVLARLTGDAPLMGRLQGIYDGAAPQGAPMPFVVLGAPTEGSGNTLDRTGWSDTLTLHVLSDYAGSKEVLELVALMDAALAAPLAMDGHTSTRMRREFLTVLVEDDGVRHAPVRYRILTFEVP